ncbi:hypothetical protein KAX17_01095 [Candidatus Bipolaricaulota bacterium]|nr:hypothetical protein [Candidatus Bipolaricaulota bacterium]
MKPVTRPKVTKEGDWVNPLKRLAGVPRPFLAGEAWAREPQSEAAAESRELLIRFYCSHREGNGSCEERLKAYFSSPDEDVFVIWGDVGIGKTWFIRYAMEVDPFSIRHMSCWAA